LHVADPADLVSVSAVLTPDDSGVAEPGAEWGGDDRANWPTAVATSLLEEDLEEPGVVGVVGDWTEPAELMAHDDKSLYITHRRPSVQY